MMRFLTLVGVFAVAVPVVSHGQRLNARRTGQVEFGGEAARVNRQVGGYRVGPYRQELRDEAPELDGILTPEFAAIWRDAFDRGSSKSVLNSRREGPNDRANGRRFDEFIDEDFPVAGDLPVAAANSVAPIPHGIDFNNSWHIPGPEDWEHGIPVQRNPEFLALNGAPDGIIVNPEPSTYVLTVGGLIAMAVFARRRRARH